MVTILDHCSRYTIECSLFLHERTQVAGDFLMDELFERKKKKNKTRYLSFKASTFRFCLLYLVSISRRYWEQNIKCSFIIYAFTIDPSLLGEPCFLHKSYKSLKPWMRTKVIEIFFKLLKKSKFWNWI